MKYELAIFDADGTLFESMYIWKNLGSEYLDLKGIEYKPSINDELRDMSINQAADYLREQYNIKDSKEKMFEDFNSLIEDFYKNEVSLKSGIEDFLIYLKSKNIKMCVATANTLDLVHMTATRLNIAHYFDDFLSCMDIGVGKDQPDIYDKALSVFDMPKQKCVVFEDALYAIETCKRNDYYTFGIYDKFSEHENEKIQQTCDEYIASYDEYLKSIS